MNCPNNSERTGMPTPITGDPWQDFTGHEQLLVALDQASGMQAVIALHSTALGPALGGVRMSLYADRPEPEVAARQDALRLSRAMTYKNALAGLSHGGGKGVIFGDPTNKSVEVLHAFGYQRHGEERMYNGMTGEMMKSQIFIGPTFYMRLKHMSRDKIHVRSTGPKQILTRQPVEGRSRVGGLRMGEMETNAMISHGSCNVLIDRILNNSDRFVMPVCQQCGLVADPEPFRQRATVQYTGENQQPYCRRCRSSQFVKKTVTPYAFKMLLQYLEAFHIKMKLHLTQDKPVDQ
jgi:hypothetical protein